ncbi:exoribonuclease II [Providencia alcalifaciens]|uniref:Exoribonuclease 2 n=1 Tax=Providencia alcalifaciens DSM 30120 TaxID=520999 RepID=B6XHJ7_9GAMM|nr:exoribonuclease II [Providencia alcalifaciens]ATG17429.1 exoribonuclease II [Providencia alcalifaciens]EEB44810.1 exoribonuclease II [Providencia alcalifaciens DSM 30120]
MFQDNPLLAQLKQTLHAKTPRVEGLVKSTEKGFGFLEVDGQKSYFIPPPQMKKVMHGDRISAAVHTDKDREFAEPEELIEPFLNRFVGKIQKKDNDNRLFVIPDHPLLKDAISCRPINGITHEFKQGDWVVAEMRRHPLKGDKGFYAEITEYITYGDDHFAPWWVTLRRHQLDRAEPAMVDSERDDEGLERVDLTHLHFVTIDSASTEDMDDALYIEKTAEGNLKLYIAIADPTSYIKEGSELDKLALARSFTNYLPGFNIPMLPRQLSDDLCSLRPNARRPALVCVTQILQDGAIDSNIEFFSAWVESKTKLVYDEVSDWLEETGSWKPQSDADTQQIRLLKEMADKRLQWRHDNALVFKDRPDYRFVLDENGNVVEIVSESRRTANRIVEEAMITANLCAANVLKNKLGFGVFNVHMGFEPLQIEQVVQTLKDNGIEANGEALLTLEGFRELRRLLDSQPTQFLDSRIRRFQTFAEVKADPGPHFGLGFEAYATWTSPIRKYTDIVNHRLLKSIIAGAPTPAKPSEELSIKLAERRRANRMAERDVGDWLYSRYLKPFEGTETRFPAEIIDITRGGVRVRLVDNGAVAFIPAPFLHSVRDEIQCSQETGSVLIKGEKAYQLNDIIDVNIAEVRMETRNIVARPAA